MPDLRQLRTFVAVAEELNFTRAAERLYLGQQAVSKAVQQLERELGVELLERTTHEVRLTPAGAALLETGHETLAAADATFERARAVGRGHSGTLKIGVTPAIGPAEREQVVRVLREGAKDLSASLLEVRPADIRCLLRDRSLDLVLARTSGAEVGVDRASLRPTPAILCAPEAHPLAAARSIRVAQLDGARVLTWSPPGTPFTDLIRARLAAAGATVELVESRVKGVALAALADADAVALMPTGWPPAQGIVQVPIEDDLTLPLLVLWPAGIRSQAVERVRVVWHREPEGPAPQIPLARGRSDLISDVLS